MDVGGTPSDPSLWSDSGGGDPRAILHQGRPAESPQELLQRLSCPGPGSRRFACVSWRCWDTAVRPARRGAVTGGRGLGREGTSSLSPTSKVAPGQAPLVTCEWTWWRSLPSPCGLDVGVPASFCLPPTTSWTRRTTQGAGGRATDPGSLNDFVEGGRDRQTPPAHASCPETWGGCEGSERSL